MIGLWEYKNHYQIKNEDGEVLLTAKEESECCERICCANARPFEMPVVDADGNEIIRFKRPFKWCMNCCCMCWYPSWMQVLEVYCGDKYLGKILEYPAWPQPKLEVIDAYDNKLFNIGGPACGIVCCSDTDFPVKRNARRKKLKNDFFFRLQMLTTDQMSETSNGFSR